MVNTTLVTAIVVGFAFFTGVPAWIEWRRSVEETKQADNPPANSSGE